MRDVVAAIILAVVIVVVLPVAILMSGAIGAMILGWRLKEDAEERHEGSELVDLNT